MDDDKKKAFLKFIDGPNKKFQELYRFHFELDRDAQDIPTLQDYQRKYTTQDHLSSREYIFWRKFLKQYPGGDNVGFIDMNQRLELYLTEK
jgi:hypothetical protein